MSVNVEDLGPGVRVRLAEFDNGDFVEPAEDATVLGVQRSRAAGTTPMVTVRVDVGVDPHDDCLRECTIDQIERLL